jgi:hypothetical protein
VSELALSPVRAAGTTEASLVHAVRAASGLLAKRAVYDARMKSPALHRICRGPLVIAVVLASVSVGAAPPSLPPASDLERKIVSYTDAHVEEAVALLERAVNINSGTMNLGGVRAVGQLFLDELAKLGFETRWVDGALVKRAGHVFAERKGTRGKRLLLLGHLDTVFEPASPFQRFERRGDRAGRQRHEGRHCGAGLRAEGAPGGWGSRWHPDRGDAHGR